jgi:uncharacterized membrane protein
VLAVVIVPANASVEYPMSLASLSNAATEIQVHAFAATAAFALGAVQLAAPKGTLPHRALGWVWVVLMLVISGSSFLIHGIRLWGPWSPIHLLSVFTPAMLVVGVLAARRDRVRAHRITMISIFAGALLLAGLFTLVPGRLMHTVLFGA